MKMRWRAVTLEEIEKGELNGAVKLARSEYYSATCVLEFQPSEQTKPDHWEKVPLYFPPGWRPVR